MVQLPIAFVLIHLYFLYNMGIYCVQGGSCGHGYVERNVSCVGPGGQTVDSHLCLALVHVGGHTWPYLARALDLNTRVIINDATLYF